MNDDFAAKVYPTILYVLELLDRIGSGRGGSPDPKEEAPRLKQYLGQLDARGRDEKDYELVKCALIYWIDEVLIGSTWSHAGRWKDQSLEWELLGTNDRAWLFYEKANVAKSLGRPDALETFYLCVALGFVGTYRAGAARTPTAKPSPAPPPPSGSAPPKKKPGEMMSWFDDGSAHGEGGETWGAGATLPPPEAAASPPAAESDRTLEAPRREQGKGGADMPPTLAEWARPIKTQIAGHVRSISPTSASESARDARPLEGQASVQRSAMMMGVMGSLCVVLFVLWTWWK